MIEIRGLTKRYGNKYAIKDVSFDINKGEVVGFLGRNGAGKTTTMNIITGYISASGGTVTVDGHDILQDPIAVKRLIGYLPEQPPVYGDMTVNEYLHFSCDLKSIDRSKQNRHVEEICEIMRITDVRMRLIRNLSKGYKQRVGFAQALVSNPPVLIFDEPTVGLDPRQIIEIRKLIKELGKSHTIVLSSHVLPEVADICEKLVIIHKGEIVAQDSLERITTGTDNRTNYTIKVMGQERAVRSALHSVSGVREVIAKGSPEKGVFEFSLEVDNDAVDFRRQAFLSMARLSSPIVQFNPERQTLEEIFIQLTAEADN